MAKLVIRLVGPPEIERDGLVSAPPRGHKAWAVLAYLVLAERPVPRARLAELIFGDAHDPLGALRWTLAQLRRALGVAGALRGDPLELVLPAEAAVDVLMLGSAEVQPAAVASGRDVVNVGAALSSTMWHFERTGGAYRADQVIAVEGVEMEGWPFPVPGLITDLVVSMDDRFLYFSDWLHGDLRQYDISDRAHPKLTGQLWLGGLRGMPSDAGRALSGGPQMLQLSLDGRRLYVTNSLYSTWDNQFYPGLDSWMLRVTCHADGGMEVDPDFFRLQRPPRRARPRPRDAAAGRGLHDRDLPMTLAHIMGIPVEESALSLAPAGIAILTGAAIVTRGRLAAIAGRLRRQ